MPRRPPQAAAATKAMDTSSDDSSDDDDMGAAATAAGGVDLGKYTPEELAELSRPINTVEVRAARVFFVSLLVVRPSHPNGIPLAVNRTSGASCLPFSRSRAWSSRYAGRWVVFFLFEKMHGCFFLTSPLPLPHSRHSAAH